MQMSGHAHGSPPLPGRSVRASFAQVGRNVPPRAAPDLLPRPPIATRWIRASSAASLRISMMAMLAVAGRCPVSMQVGYGTSLASLGTIWRSAASGCCDNGELVRRAMEICAHATGVLPTTIAVATVLWAAGVDKGWPSDRPMGLLTVILTGAVILGVHVVSSTW